MLYALHQYRARAAQILSRRAERYDDQRGPVLLTAILVLAVLLAIVFAARA